VHLLVSVPYWWFFILREEHRLVVFKKRVLRRLLTKGPEVKGAWTIVHEEEINALCSWLYILECSSEGRDGRGMWHVWGRLEMHTRFRGKMKGRSPLRRPSRRWVNNMKMDLPEVEWEGVDVINLAEVKGWWRSVEGTSMSLRAP